MADLGSPSCQSVGALTNLPTVLTFPVAFTLRASSISSLWDDLL